MKINKAKKIITFDNLDNHRDARSATLAIVNRPNGKKFTVTKPVYDYGRRVQFTPPEYNLMDIGVLEDVESYVRQAFQKKTALMFKEGMEFTGKNKLTIDYIKTRITQMEYVSGGSWKELLRETGYALISRSNFFWVKVRKAKASGGKVIAGIQPVAAYFGMGAENVKIKKDQNGKIVKYRQAMPDGRFREFSPRDVIHFYAHKKSGFSFGTPSIVPAKEDIRALRRIEENVELLIYQTLFPIFQYRVGTETKPSGDIRLSDGTLMSEVDYVRGQIADMPAEGGIVTPERHEIKYIGAEGKALKARDYLDYFKQRVFSGLGISGVDLGEGGTANRATAATMSRSMVDGVKDYQSLIEDKVDKEVIRELLFESSFLFDVLSPDETVSLEFKEIDIEEQLKKNTNAQVLYNGNIIDVNEARKASGYVPLTEDQEPSMFSERVAVKQLEMTLASQAAISKASASSDPAANKAKNQNAPTNQHGTKTGPQKSTLDTFILKDGATNNMSRALKSDISEHIRRQVIDRKWIHTVIKLGEDSVIKKYVGITRKAFAKGLKDSGLKTSEITDSLLLEYQDSREITESFIKKYFKDVEGNVQNTLDKLTNQGEKRSIIGSEIKAVFDKISYRGKFIDGTERMRAYNYGKAIGLKAKGFLSAKVISNSNCEQCQAEPQTISLESLNILNLPPFHPNSKATIEGKSE